MIMALFQIGYLNPVKNYINHLNLIVKKPETDILTLPLCSCYTNSVAIESILFFTTPFLKLAILSKKAEKYVF